MRLNLLIIGGTGIISSAVTELLAAQNHSLYMLNRGLHSRSFHKAVIPLVCDINDEKNVKELIRGLFFDCVIDFTIQLPSEIRRDYEYFQDSTRQFIFISSSSVYRRPLSSYQVTESTPVYNPYWDYAQNKLACEEELQTLYRTCNFPMTIVRPGHTYNETWLPLCISGAKGCWTVIRRILEEKPTIIPGDGSSLWSVTNHRDFARALSGLIGNPQAIGETVNISSDEVLTWNQIYHTIADTLGVPLHPFYVSSMFLDQAGPYGLKRCLTGERTQSIVFQNDKLKRLSPGFRAKIPFAAGIRQSLEYLLTHPEEQVEDVIFDQWCDALADSLTKAAKELKEQFPNYE